jgi:hypothetical protein
MAMATPSTIPAANQSKDARMNALMNHSIVPARSESRPSRVS